MTAQAGGHDVWQAVLDMVKSVSEVMLSSLPNFWKISQAFMDGKYRKVCVNFVYIILVFDVGSRM